MVVIMGVSGCGKSTLGELLAGRVGGLFADADSFHSAANIEMMSHGHPLCDADREPWLRALRQQIEQWLEGSRVAFLACSALKRSYRDTLRNGLSEIAFIYLEGSETEIAARLAGRTNHFMASQLLRSQFEALEPPDVSESAVTIATSLSPIEQVEKVLALFSVPRRPTLRNT